MDPRDIHKMDQAMAAVKEYAAPGVWNMFQAFLAVGFTRTEAIILLLHFTPGTIRTLQLPEEKSADK